MGEYKKESIGLWLTIYIVISSLAGILDFYFRNCSVIEVAMLTLIGLVIRPILDIFVDACLYLIKKKRFQISNNQAKFVSKLTKNEYWSTWIVASSLKEEFKYRGPFYVLMIGLQFVHFEFSIPIWALIIIGDGLIFAYRHTGWGISPLEFLVHTTNGSFYCLLVLASGSLIPPIFCHAAWNLIYASRLKYGS